MIRKSYGYLLNFLTILNFLVVLSNDVEIVVLSVFKTWYGTRVVSEIMRVERGDLVDSSISFFSERKSKISILDSFFPFESEYATVTVSVLFVFVVSASTNDNDVLNKKKI